MNSTFWANQFIGAVFWIGGMFVINDWRINVGLFLIIMGDNIQKSVKFKGKGLNIEPLQNWVE